MGKDNHPRIRQRAKLERKRKNIANYDRVLVVCEGKKTEPQYFEEIRQHHRLQTSNVKIMPSSYGTTPQQVIDFARDEIKKIPSWEQVFCVFDRDDHPNFLNALKSAISLNNKFKNELGEPIGFSAIPSNPCFELWLLLHFIPITTEIQRDKVLSHLKHSTRLPNYKKGKNGVFQSTKERLSAAFKNSDKLTKDSSISDNPYTAVGDLVKYLMKLSDFS